MTRPNHTTTQTDAEQEFEQNKPRLIATAIAGLMVAVIAFPDKASLSVKTSAELVCTFLGLAMITYAGLAYKSLSAEATRGRATINQFFQLHLHQHVHHHQPGQPQTPTHTPAGESPAQQ
ncbi:MAG: hypothetical protein P1U40_06575 [Coxiellaceae bacterium]|nr:hypothetical protein [Coxiellaceae bacterium]